MALTHAEQLLQDLGITEPGEIDLDAIAYHLGAVVRYRALRGCEARVIGNRDNAIITINANSPPRRRRFSIAHELAHWRYDRGKVLACRVEELGQVKASHAEQRADTFAADLLMPRYLFQPLARQHAKLTFKVVDDLAAVFEASRTATAIRLVQGDYFPAILVCHGPAGRKWFFRAPGVPAKWFPNASLDAASRAMDVLYRQAPDCLHPRKIGAAAWFENGDAPRFEVTEQTARAGNGDVLTLVSIVDRDMLRDR